MRYFKSSIVQFKSRNFWYELSYAVSFVLLFSSLLFLSCLLQADTKRKVEQISEELKSLDEMLAGNEGADREMDVTEDVTSPVPHDDQDQLDEKGIVILHRH